MKTWLMGLACDATPSMAQCCAQLAPIIPQLSDLAGIAQDSRWHGEGDVMRHSTMVMDALYGLLAGPAAHIRGVRRQALILAAALHDIGKLTCSKRVLRDGIAYIVSPGHEAAGRNLLAFLLPELPLSFDVIWSVLGLVGEHHQPKLLVIKNKNRGEYLALSRRVDTELLYWLEQADMRGRICADLPAQLSLLDEFELFAREYGVWGRAFTPSVLQQPLQRETAAAQQYVWARGIRWLQQDSISLAEEALARGYQHKTHHARLVILCGPSGVGKSSFVAQHYRDWQVISLDAIREELFTDRQLQQHNRQVLNLARTRLKQGLRCGADMVWDATSLRQDFRQQLISLADDYHALVTLVVFIAPRSRVLLRNRQRRVAVPQAVMLQQFARYEFPQVDETHCYQVWDDQGQLCWQSGYFVPAEMAEI